MSKSNKCVFCECQIKKGEEAYMDRSIYCTKCFNNAKGWNKKITDNTKKLQTHWLVVDRIEKKRAEANYRPGKHGKLKIDY